MTFTKLLNAQFTSKEELSIAFIPAFVLFWVLYVFEGFEIDQGLSSTGHGFLSRSLLFFFLNVVWYGVSEKVANRRKRKSKYQKIWQSILQIFIGAHLTFLLFNYFWNFTEWSWQAYFLLMAEYGSVMILPIVGIRLVFDFSGKKTTQSSHQLLKLSSTSQNQSLSLRSSNLLALKAEGNYVKVYYKAEETVKTLLLRNTLKNLEKQLTSSPNILRSHRSYLVNKEAVKSIVKKASQCELDLGFELEIPVSASFLKSFES